MCETCGCAHGTVQQPIEAHQSVDVVRRLMDANDRAAAHNREHFAAHGVAVVNLMSSPGAGKTALLEATIEALKHEFAIAVIEGDLETDNDARRIRAHGIPAVQITTGGACHLDAQMVHEALHAQPLAGLDLLFIENVGNLVCPASFDLGAHRNVVLLSVTEGDDKPAKYPVMFRAADLVLITKTDLLGAIDDFDLARAERAVRALANPAPVVALSARRASNLDAWTAWLRRELRDLRRSFPHAGGPIQEPHHEHDKTLA
jgi:hydrogenase nickel incorporation protein HypB